MQTTRKRNVVTRNRSGCVTCRTRRLKCDEGKPNCFNCTRLRLQCGGYITRFRFKDQTQSLQRKLDGAARTKPPSRPVDATPSPVPEQTLLPSLSSPAQDIVNSSSDEGIELPQSNGASYDAHQRVIFDAATSLSLIAGIFSHPFNPTVSREVHIREESANVLSPTYSHDGGLYTEGMPEDQGRISSIHSTPNEPLDASHSTIPDNGLQNSPWSHSETDLGGFSTVDQQPKPPPIAPPGLVETAKFAEDMIYYHHLCDASEYGLLSALGLRDILQIENLDKGFFHAALALSASHVSLSSDSTAMVDAATIHALDHFVEALGSMRTAQLSDDIVTIDAPSTEQSTITWLATLLLIANFELGRGQMKLWYVHSHAGVTFLSQNIDRVRKLPVGEPIIRSFSRIAALLEIFDRSYSDHRSLALSNVSVLLSNSLKNSSDPADRLLHILPRVVEFEEECRASPELDEYWRHQALNLVAQLKAWRKSLDDRDVPSRDELQADPWKDGDSNSTPSIRPLAMNRATEPIKAATSFMHYLVSLIRLETKYLPGAGRQLPANANRLILVACRLAAGVTTSSCATINAYGHGMVPAMMNAYYLSEDNAAKNWIKDWISKFSFDREGIWNVRHAHRLLKYVDNEYSKRGSRQHWEIIKVRMVDLEEEEIPQDGNEDVDRFSVEIYSRCRRGWSIDFVDIP